MEMRAIADIIYSGEDIDKKMALNDIYYEMADYIKKWKPDAYEQFCEKAEDIIYVLDEDDAEMIVKKMKPHGQVKTYEEVKDYFAKKGIAEKMCEYFLAVNMVWNDYHRTAVAHNMDTDDFYYDLAFDFVNDPDGEKHKVAKYFMAK